MKPVPGITVITVARKPMSEGTVVENVLKWEAGGLNIDGARVGFQDQLMALPGSLPNAHKGFQGKAFSNKDRSHGDPRAKQSPLGRWPSNIVFEHLPGCRCGGTRKVKGARTDTRPEGDGGRTDQSQWRFRPTDVTRRGYSNDKGEETIEDWVCVEGCPVAELDRQSGILTSGALSAKVQRGSFGQNKIYGKSDGRGVGTSYQASSGGASRFFMQVQE